jgi:hypothetical protein
MGSLRSFMAGYSDAKKQECAHSSSSSIGISDKVFQRFILPSCLLTGRGTVLKSFDLELLLRAIAEE